jgi:hypothetical protein
MTGETVVVIVLVAGCLVTGVLGLVRAVRRRAAGQNSTILRFNSLFAIGVGIGLLVLYCGVHRE